METYRLGTTLTIKWRLKDSDDQPFSLSGYDFTLQYRTGRGVNTAQVTTSQEEYGEKTDNVLKWTFTGAQQQYAGAYDLLLTIRSNGKVVCTQVYNNAFYLCRSEVSGSGNIKSATVELSSTAEWCIFGDKDTYIENTKAQLIGDSGDDSAKDTIYGAKAYADVSSQKAKEEEAAARTEADNSLQEKITEEATARSTTDEQLAQELQDLSSDLSTETNARKSEDTDLLSKIQAESSSRQTDIEQVNQTIKSETSSREDGDSALQSRLNTEAETRKANDDAISAELQEEVLARSNADKTLQTNIDAEVKLREDKDNTLQSNINTEAATRNNADNTLQLNINAEISSRTAADTTLQNNIDANSSDIDRIQETLGHYSKRSDIALTAKETGYVINTSGVKTAKSGWAMAEFSAEKGVEYLFKPGTIDGSVCIFAQKVTTKATRAIDYTYTYDDEGRVKTATATYNGATYVYTYAYDEETGAQTITDAGGNIVSALPYQYETTVGTYLPMTRLNAGAELPQDGYCRLMSHFQGNASLTVVVSYKVGSADLTMKAVKDGVFASVATQLGNLSGNISSTQSALDSNDHQTAENEADIEGILATYGNNDSRDIRLLCGQPEVFYGEGTPQEGIVPTNWKQFDPETGEGYNWTGLPSALGQMYVNTTATSNPAYISVRDGEYELKWLNI